MGPMLQEAEDGHQLGNTDKRQTVEEAVQELVSALDAAHEQHEMDSVLVPDPMQEEVFENFDLAAQVEDHGKTVTGQQASLCEHVVSSQATLSAEAIMQPIDSSGEPCGPVVGPPVLQQYGKETLHEQYGPNDSDLKLPYIKELPTPILNAPPATEATDSQKSLDTPLKEHSKRKSTRLASRPKSNLTMEQQATTLLMKKCGIFEGQNSNEAPSVQKLSEQFAGTLREDTFTEYREMFGLPAEDDTDYLGAIAIHADA